jgi:hypothetical protein
MVIFYRDGLVNFLYARPAARARNGPGSRATAPFMLNSVLTASYD